MRITSDSFHAACFLNAVLGRLPDLFGPEVCQWNYDGEYLVVLELRGEDDEETPRISLNPRTDAQRKLAHEIIGYCATSNYEWHLERR